MLSGITTKLSIILWPLSLLYGAGVRLRNQLFDWGILKSKTFDVPIICIGNLAVGGTGKTPLTEYLIRMLKSKFRIAVVSRGYKRSTKGLVLATQEHTCQEIGDEPFQMRQKFPDILIALDGNRCRAIEHLLSLPKEQRPEVILLDDAFQHRYVAASFTILLTDYGCMFYQDHLLPIGRLREPANGKQRADLIIVSKTPIDLKPIEYRITETNMHLKAHQAVFFTYIQYGSLQPIFPNALPIVHPFPQEYSILLVTGIASPRPLIEEVKKWGNELRILSFPDHHDFKESDIKKMHARFQAISNKQKIILTTEKDASRLSQNPYITEDMKQHLFYIPICIGFQNEQDKEFEQTIVKHIKTFQQNKILW